MNWIIFQWIGFSIFVILAIYFVCKKQAQNLLELYFWGLVFAICYIPIGTNLSPCKIVAMAQLVYMVIYKPNNNIVPVVLRYIAIVFFILILISDLVAIIFPPENKTMLSPVMRLLMQNYTYLTAIILLFYCRWCKVDCLSAFFPKYCLIVEVAIIIGCIHWLLNYLLIDFMPIVRPDYSMSTDVSTMFGGDIVKRVYGFAGEPKNLGFLLLPYLFISLYTAMIKHYRKRNKLYHYIFLGLGLWVLLNTYSSSAIIAFIITILIFLFVSLSKINEKIIALFMFVVIMAAGYLIYSGTQSEQYQINFDFWNSMEERTFGRAVNELENDRQETLIFNKFKEAHPLYILFGWGIGQYTFYVKGMSDGIWLIPVQSGAVLTLTDFGVLGFIFYIFLGGWIFYRLCLLRKKPYWLAKSFFYATLVSYVGSLMYGNVVTCWVYLMLAEYALIEDKEKEIKIKV